jgi:hypothetical protein
VGLLSGVLPGLRDLRTPLTAGYVWLLGIWLLFADVDPIRVPAENVAARFRPLERAYGPAALLVASTATAFVIGGLTSIDTDRLRLNPLERVTTFPYLRLMRALVFRAGFNRTPSELEASRQRFRMYDLNRLAQFFPQVVADRQSTVNGLRVEVWKATQRFDPSSLAVRLMLVNPGLWDQYDRMLAEAEFRLALTFPCLLLGVGVGIHGAWWAGVLVGVLAVALYRAGDAKLRSANGVLITALITRSITDPELDRLVQSTAYYHAGAGLMSPHRAEAPADHLIQGECEHLAEASTAVSPATSPDDCLDCLALGERDWVHLRMCQTCGYVACCDFSPRRHARLHSAQTSHPVVRSIERGESWRWCYIDGQVG